MKSRGELAGKGAQVVLAARNPAKGEQALAHIPQAHPQARANFLAMDMADLSSVACDLYVRGLMTGNEVRDWLGMTPKKDLDQLVMLENYIPAGMIGDQKKLIQDQQKEGKDA